MDPFDEPYEDEEEYWDDFDPFPMKIYARKRSNKGGKYVRMTKWQSQLSRM